jgi:hypothetical protein
VLALRLEGARAAASTAAVVINARLGTNSELVPKPALIGPDLA